MSNSIRMYRAVFFAGLVAIIYSVWACAEPSFAQPIVTNVEKITDNELSTAIKKYYEAESEKNWSATYAARSPEYRKLVPFDVYKDGMEQGAADWKLRQIDVLDTSQSQKGTTLVRIRFDEEFGPKAAQKYFEGRVNEGMNRRIETTLWKRINDRWYCVNAGSRGRFPEPLRDY